MKDPCRLAAARINEGRITTALKPKMVWYVWVRASAGERALGVVDVPSGRSEKAKWI